MKTLKIRLKSAFQHWPDNDMSKDHFYTSYRGTAAYPTETALYGMIECAFGYSDEHEAEKRELEKKISFGTPIRTPKRYFKDYEKSHSSYAPHSWTSRFLGMKFYNQEAVIRSGNPNPTRNNGGARISEEFSGVIMCHNEDQETEKGMVSVYVISGNTENSVQVFEDFGMKGVENEHTETICGIDFKTLETEEKSVSYAYFDDCYLAVVIELTYESVKDRTDIISGFGKAGNRDLTEVKPYKRVYNLVTAKPLFDWQTFKRADGKRNKQSPTMTIHEYLADADFLVDIYGEEEVLKEVAKRLDNPRFIYYFGDRKGSPTTRANQGIWEDCPFGEQKRRNR